MQSAQQRWIEEKAHIRVPRSLLKMCGIFFTIALVGHWIGSLRFMVAKFAEFPNSSWTTALAGEDATTQYLWSVFKTLYMLVGGEDMWPSGYSLSCNELTGWCAVESWMNMVLLYAGQFMMAFVTGVVTTIIQNKDRASHEYQEKVELMEEYMQFQKLPNDLKWNIRDYYHRKFREQKIFDGTQRRAAPCTAPPRPAMPCTAAYRHAPHRPAPSRTSAHCRAPHRHAPHRHAPHRRTPPRTAAHRHAPPRTAAHRHAPPRTALHRHAPHPCT